MADSIRYLLLQMRNPDDPMAGHEVECFARSLNCSVKQIRVLDLLRQRPTQEDFDQCDAVLLGGSGDYSVAKGGPWLDAALESMRELHSMSKPTFASCWGFQAMAVAMGGAVISDPDCAEVGTIDMHLTSQGRDDPVFGSLSGTFPAQVGHQDTVDRLPPDAIRLVSSDRSLNHAYRFRDKPIWCTQFHPELSREKLLDRLRTYPSYVEGIARMRFDEFVKTCRESPDASMILPRFVEHIRADGKL